ncbi:MAG: MATE family efflux transporter [Eubacteriales bacterium]|nr:MATE family efflux transporter [Eubacteriales bacterium]
MTYDLTNGNITKNLLKFALPLMVGNLLQQFYNIADTWVVGRFLGADALAAVGSSYTLMVFLTSVLLGLCMGSGAFFSIQFGKKDFDRLKNGFFLSFLFIGAITVILNILVFLTMDGILLFMRVPREILPLMEEYLFYVFWGIFATFLYNYFANLLRAVGDSVTPLIFLAVCAVLNIILDLLFVLVFRWGVKGAAVATMLSQYVSGIGIFIYYYIRFSDLRVKKEHMHWNRAILKEISEFSLLTCAQQSVMNLGILMVQGLVNSFGTAVMAAFAASVKIDSFAYMPVQDFGNAFSTFIAQNYGAGKKERIRSGIRSAMFVSVIFSIFAGVLVCLSAPFLLRFFIDASRTDIIGIGTGYLRIEGSFYFGIGLLFLFYGYFRAVQRPGISVILTVISLGTRVILAYVLSAIPFIGVTGIWVSIPVGWILADITGFVLMKRKPQII